MRPAEDPGGSRPPKDAPRCMRDLLLLAPYLPMTRELEIDYDAADPDVLVQIGDNADAAMRTLHLGMSAIGVLLAHAAPEIECSDIEANAIEALGWLLAELGDFAATAHCLSVACRRFTADYAPLTRRTVANVRP